MPAPDANSEQWFVIKQPDGHCAIAPEPPADRDVKHWGPFSSQTEAIARRVGLIRAGHCQPR